MTSGMTRAGETSVAMAVFLGLAVAASAADIRFVAPDIPPHFEPGEKGRIGEPMALALAQCGHRARLELVPFGRHWKTYAEDAQYDALATAEADQRFPGFSTEPFMHLQDGATVLAEGGMAEVGNVSELAGKRVIAFPDARRILSIDAAVPRFAYYLELGDRHDQLRPLFAGRVDAVLADGLITARFINGMRTDLQREKAVGIDPTIKVRFRRLFAPGPQRLYFRSEAVARDFDRCWKALVATGEAARIAEKYIQPYRAILADQYPVL
jgi:polar amino acid transport system substrate-binding protein